VESRFLENKADLKKVNAIFASSDIWKHTVDQFYFESRFGLGGIGAMGFDEAKVVGLDKAAKGKGFEHYAVYAAVSHS